MLINCPECNQMVSDKAETCPHCGIRLNNNVNVNGNVNPNPNQKQGTKSHKALIASLIIALIIMGVGYYFYSQSLKEKEQEAYELAMQSNDPMVMQNYLSRYQDAPREHRDSVNAHLNMLKEEDLEWENAVNSGLRSALENYIKENPESPHLSEAKNKIDSIDYRKAEHDYKVSNSIEALMKYLKEHPDGRFSIQAQNIIDELKAVEVTPEELATVKSVCKKFFQAINSKNDSKLLDTVTDILDQFLNRNNASNSDVVEFMNRLYKSDITNMNWHILDNYKAEKVDNGNGGKNIRVQFGAEQHIERTDPDKETLGKYIVSAEVTPEGRITKFNMKKVKE
ncbi:MAG: zinc ribbon domain-containing protein [Prevotella sp.]|nr:zinc ribbon domain-containing protein [Prevotella sp.]